MKIVLVLLLIDILIAVVLKVLLSIQNKSKTSIQRQSIKFNIDMEKHLNNAQLIDNIKANEGNIIRDSSEHFYTGIIKELNTVRDKDLIENNIIKIVNSKMNSIMGVQQ